MDLSIAIIHAYILHKLAKRFSTWLLMNCDFRLIISSEKAYKSKENLFFAFDVIACLISAIYMDFLFELYSSRHIHSSTCNNEEFVVAGQQIELVNYSFSKQKG